MSDETGTPDIDGPVSDPPPGQPAGPSPDAGTKRGAGRRIAAIVVAIALIGGGIGGGLALTSGSSGANDATQAVTNLLVAANHSDALGALDALVPGERTALEPGLTGLVGQLSRLKILAPGVSLSDVRGLSLDFTGIRLTSSAVAPDLAAVSVVGGSLRASVDGKKLPVGSFVTNLAGGTIAKLAQSQTSAVRSGRTPIVTEEVDGTWYVSLGYTIAFDSLRSGGKSGTPPPASEAVTPVGSASAVGAVQSLFADVSSFDLRALISGLAPGEMGALQRYAPLFLPKADKAVAKGRHGARLVITASHLSTVPVAGGTLVKLGSIGFSLTVQGVTIKYSGGCIDIQTAGTTIRRCPTAAQRSSGTQRILAVLPPDLRSLVHRLGSARPPVGIVTVESGGRWYVSPVGTLLDDVNGYAAIFQPGDLTTLAKLAGNKAELRSIGNAIEKIELGGLASGSLVL